MKIRFTESQLKRKIYEAVNQELNKYYCNNLFEKEKRFHLTEGLTCTYNIGKVVRILNRKYDLKGNGIRFSPFDYNRSSKNDFFSTVRGKLNGEELRTTQETDNWIRFELIFNDGLKR